MSDFQREPDWWQAEDGFWYPPAVPRPVGPPAVTDTPRGPVNTAASQLPIEKPSRPRRHTWILAIVGTFAVAAVIGWAVQNGDDDDSEAPRTTPRPLTADDLIDITSAGPTSPPAEWDVHCPGAQREVAYLSDFRNKGASYTIQAPTGTRQGEFDPPLKNKSGTDGLRFCFSPGEFVYLSVQNMGTGYGASCEIQVDGVTISSNESRGDYVIAGCDGQA